jgi:hypothetical protein
VSQKATTQSLSMQDYFTTTLSSSVAVSDTVISLNAVPTTSEGYLVIDPNNATTREVIYFNSKSSSTVTCPDATSGSSRGLGGTTVQTHASGTAVEMRNVAEYWLELQSGNSNTGMQQYWDEGSFDYVQSGCVWTADAAGSTKAASMTSGVVYIDGRRLTVSSVSARTFTASKDTYVDVTYTARTASLVYTEVTNNAASPALAANSIRIAIVVTGATSIAAAGSINQGDPACVLPIASSVAYSVTDSLGNLICNRTPSPGLIGYRQITSSFNSGTTATTAVTGLSLPVIVPTSRRVKITTYCEALTPSSTFTTVALSIWDGTVGSGTQLQQASSDPSSSNTATVSATAIAYAQASGSKTYNVGIAKASSGTPNVTATSTAPAYISVELV